jgi:hypothetical protein
MFGSGSKKQSKPPYNVQLLTTEYLIEGWIAPEEYEVGGDNVFSQAARLEEDEGGIDAFQAIRMTDVKIRPTGILDSPEETFQEWDLSVLDGVVAIIPLDQACLKVMQKAFKDFRYPVEARIYIGPYLIRAKLLSSSTQRDLSPFATSQLIPLEDAEIDCLVQGSKLKGFRVPWLILNGDSLLHGCSLT